LILIDGPDTPIGPRLPWTWGSGVATAVGGELKGVVVTYARRYYGNHESVIEPLGKALLHPSIAHSIPPTVAIK